MMSLPSHRGIAIAGIAVIGAAWGGIWVCNNIIRADLVTQNLAKTEKHTEALYYALLNTIQNMGGILQSIAMMLATLLFGYVSGENPGPQPGMAFRFLIGFAPLVGLSLSWLSARSFFKDYLYKMPA
jgi:GPH family glycoside/pentoside/hexuronide:cation symporter